MPPSKIDPVGSVNLGSSNILFTLALFLIYIASSCYGLYLIKTATKIVSLTLFFGFLFYALGAGIWIYILRKYPLSSAFPAAAGSLVIATVIIGIVFLGEKYQTHQYVGALLVIAGIFFVSQGNQ